MLIPIYWIATAAYSVERPQFNCSDRIRVARRFRDDAPGRFAFGNIASG
jgi:hypothetical protein